MRRIQISALLISMALFSAAPAFASATPEGESEVQLTMASLAYQSKNYAGCRKILDGILAKDPANAGAREMMALIQKASDDQDGAAKTYRALLSSAPSERQPAYHFELAMILYKQKKLDEARRHFDLAAKSLFNPGTSHFFLGVMDFNAKEWRSARNHLTASLVYDDARTMTPVTRYYLASTYAQLGKTDAAIHSYDEVERSAATTSNSGIDELVKGVRTNALKELKALDKDQKYASLTLMQQFDSNVQTNPSEVDNPVAASSQRSGKSVLSIAAGYSSSPTRDIQITPAFSYYTNYNYNYLARTFNFMTFSPSLFAVYKPYARLSAGIKADGIFSMQNMLDPGQSTQALKYRPFSLTGDIGPVVKYELTPRVSIASETYYRPTDFYLDAATGDNRRSGGGVFQKMTAEFVSGYPWWTPSAYLSFEWVHSSGLNFRSYNGGGGIANTAAVTDKLSLTGSIDILYSDYFATTQPERQDVNLVFRLAGSYPVATHWTVVGDLSYTDNESSISTIYKYDRWVLDGGFTYAF